MSERETPFFVGYLPVPRRLAGLLLGIAFAAVAGFALLSFSVGSTQDNPGDGRLRFDFGRQTVSGILQVQPYPALFVTEGSDHVAAGESLMLAGSGKFGVIPEVERIGAAGAEVSGIIVNRGTIRMLLVSNLAKDIKPADVSASAPDPVDLGRWRIAGEICDGKCLAGAMRPGRGLAHKACAELCIQGGVPPVFVTTQPVEGHEFLMIGGADGGPLPQALRDRVGVYVSLEGRVEDRGGMLVFLADETSLEVLP